LASDKELSDFLKSVEKRAFKRAAYAVRDDDAALDIVQDSMIRLAEKYIDRPAAELPLLFQRILQNTIRDFYRRQKVRSTWTTPISSLVGGDADDDYDPLDSIDVENESPYAAPPLKQLERAQVLEFIEKCLHKLPPRQREAFILRYWEEMDVAEAADAGDEIAFRRQLGRLDALDHVVLERDHHAAAAGRI